MKLVNLEDVNKILDTKNTNENEIIKRINSLPTHDPEKVLREMIEENNKLYSRD